MSALPKPPPSSAVETVDTRFLETLMGYNARRASLAIVEHFMRRMAPYDLRIVDFSVLSLIAHNPGITSRQLCSTLGVLPPNLVPIISALEKRQLVERHPHPSDGRALGLQLTPAGQALMARAEAEAVALENDAAPGLTARRAPHADSPAAKGLSALTAGLPQMRPGAGKSVFCSGKPTAGRRGEL